MEEYPANSDRGVEAFSPTFRDLLAIGFRRRRLVLVSFSGVLLGALLAAVFLPKQYESRLEILVKHERVDPVVTPEPNSAPQLTAELVTEEDLNSEVELIQGRDLLEKVVVACGLHLSKGPLLPFLKSGREPEDSMRIPRAVRALESDLRVEPVKKSNLIEIRYASSDPELAARVLTTLADLYLAKHLAVHRPPGASDFFRQQAEQYRERLAAAEAQLGEFSRDGNAVSAQMERDIVLQKKAEFEGVLQQTRATIAEAAGRIRALEAEMRSTPRRLNTESRASDNAQLLEQLKSTLLNLELKRTGLLGKFQPDYPPVKEMDQEIAQTRAALEAELGRPVHEETTAQNPAYQWLSDELTKTKADLASFRARAWETSRVVDAYRRSAILLNGKGLLQQDLLRNTKVEETNYLLYVNKREEARISDALDNKRIANVSIAEAATVPALPVHSSAFFFVVGGLLAVLTSLGLAFVAEYFDPSFRTPEELESWLSVPVLAAMPRRGH